MHNSCAHTHITRVDAQNKCYHCGVPVDWIDTDPAPSQPHAANESLTITDDLLQRAKSIIGTKPVRAAGYRVKVFLIEADKGLDAGVDAPTLKKAGFQTKSENQKAKEDKGTDIAIVVDVGPVAFTGEMTGNTPWVKVGQVIRMLRYTGYRYEEPPGSGRWYGLVNDEDLLGVYDENVLEAE